MAGGKVVGLKQSEFGIAVSSLRAATEGLTPSISDVGEVVCQSDTMRQYRVALSELESLLELYKALLEKDRGGLLCRVGGRWWGFRLILMS